MKVAYAASRNLYPWLKPTITSLLEHNDVETIYLIIEDDEVPEGLPKANYKVFNASGQTLFGPECPNIRSMFTYLAMMRATYPDLFPEDERVISLDVDTIIVDSLEPLWNLDMTGKWIAAVPEKQTAYNPFRNEHYWNVGVCVYNLDEMRKWRVSELCVDFLNHGQWMCVEQDALNLFAGCTGRIATIDLRWNESIVTGMTQNPAVVHYAGFPDWTIRDRMVRKEYLDRYL